jgi:hypothetical protein
MIKCIRTLCNHRERPGITYFVQIRRQRLEISYGFDNFRRVIIVVTSVMVFLATFWLSLESLAWRSRYSPVVLLHSCSNTGPGLARHIFDGWFNKAQGGARWARTSAVITGRAQGMSNETHQWPCHAGFIGN